MAFRPDRRLREPVYRQLADHLRELIEAGRLGAGQKLPATRELAQALALSRNTVTLAYQALDDAGLVSAHVGQGTFVARRPGGPALRVAGAPPEPEAFAWEGLLANRSRGLRLPAIVRGGGFAPRVAFDFRCGRVAAAELPVAELRRAFGRAVDRHLPELANRLDPQGWPPLREALARGLLARGIRCDAAEVLVVGGAQQALDLLGRLLLDPGDAVALEQPGYVGAALAFAASEAHCIGVPVDPQGLRIDALARVLRRRRVKLVYTTPAVQCPTGVALDEGRREALLELAEAHQVPVIEDDYDGEFRLGGPAVPALKTADRDGRVIYLGTFSKAVFPGLRLGYLVAPAPLVRRLAEARAVSDYGSSLVPQAALAELLDGGAMERHVRRTRRRHAERLEAMLTALAENLPEGTRWLRPAGGAAVWVTLPPELDARALHAEALAAGVAYAPDALFSLDEHWGASLQLGFAEASARSIHDGLAVLGEIVTRHLHGLPRPAAAGSAGGHALRDAQEDRP